MNPANMIFQHYMQKPQTRTTICKDRLSRVGEVDKTQLALIREMKNNKSAVFHFDPHIAWETDKDQSSARTHKTHVYKAANLPTRNADKTDFDQTQDATTSNFTQDRATPHTLQAPGGSRDVDSTADMSNAKYMDRHGAPLGKKSSVKYNGTADGRERDMGDMESMSRRTVRARANGTTAALKGSKL
jgi:hypothetical protein